MTALCGGGTSSLRTGISDVIALSATGITAFLSTLIDPVAASIVGPIIAAGITIDAANYCANDPPSDPGVTAQDIIDALNFTNVSAQLAAAAKLEQWFLSRYWYQICQCNSIVTPNPPTLSNPGPVDSNPGLPSSQSQTPCWDTTVSHTLAATVAPSTQCHQIDVPELFPGINTAQFDTASGCDTHLVTPRAIPAGINNVTIEGTIDSLPTNVFHPAVDIGFLTATRTFISTFSFGWGTTDPLTQSNTLTIPANAAFWYCYITNNAATANHTITLELSFFCSGTGPGGLLPACCPPDPLLQGLIRQVMAMQQTLQADTELIQRYLLPFAYIAGTAHSGLTGTGSIPISRLIGVKWSVTTIPSHYGVSEGNPDYHFDLGFATILTADGLILEKRITAANQVWQSRLFAEAVTFGYFLNPGVVMTVTELEAEP